MKILTTNFLTCAVKTCKTSAASFPLHFKDAELEEVAMEFNPIFLTNLLPRLEWDALRTTARELGFDTLPEGRPEFGNLEAARGDVSGDVGGEMDVDEEMLNEGDQAVDEVGVGKVNQAQGLSEEDLIVLRELHRLLLETSVVEGKMVCGNCGFEYKIKDGIANFLLPSHLV